VQEEIILIIGQTPYFQCLVVILVEEMDDGEVITLLIIDEVVELFIEQEDEVELLVLIILTA
jgi:hypothetical protein